MSEKWTALSLWNEIYNFCKDHLTFFGEKQQHKTFYFFFTRIFCWLESLPGKNWLLIIFNCEIFTIFRMSVNFEFLLINAIQQKKTGKFEIGWTWWMFQFQIGFVYSFFSSHAVAYASMKLQKKKKIYVKLGKFNFFHQLFHVPMQIQVFFCKTFSFGFKFQVIQWKRFHPLNQVWLGKKKRVK